MRVGLLYDVRIAADEVGSPPDANSELLQAFELDELLSGLRDAGHVVTLIPGVGPLLSRASYWRRRLDLVLNKSVGYTGLDRKVHAAAILEAARLPYTGSGPYALALSRHKYHAKLVAAAAGLLVPPGCLVPPATHDELGRLRYPVIVKPVAESSSIGVTIDSLAVSPTEAFQKAMALVATYQQAALVETFVRGAEVEVPLFLDPRPRCLGILGFSSGGQPVEDDVFLRSEAVYHDEYSFATPPTYVQQRRVETAALRAAEVFGLRDYGRIDFRVDRNSNPWFIEVSTHPHLQHHSSFFVLARTRGLSYSQMLDELIRITARRAGLG